MHFKILGAHCDLIYSGLIFRTSLGIKGIIWGLDYQNWDQTPLGHQSTMLSPGLPPLVLTSSPLGGTRIRKSGTVFACWFGEAFPPGKVRWHCCWCKIGRGRTNPANWARSGQPRERSQSTTTSQLPQMLNGLICLWKCWWSSADSCKDDWVKHLLQLEKLLRLLTGGSNCLATPCIYRVILKKEKQNKNRWVLSKKIFCSNIGLSSLQCTFETSAKSFVTAFILLCRAREIYESSSIQKGKIFSK